VLSPLPLSEEASGRIAGIPLHVLTSLAGVVGIGVGLFFAAGTAVMYPLTTGGKPIVAPPIVGIISYETMMLFAIVTTFLAVAISIRYTNRAIRSRDASIDDGLIAVIVQVPVFGTVAGAVQEVLERAGAIEVRLSVIPAREVSLKQAPRHAAWAIVVLGLAGAMLGCSQDMQQQASYEPQEAPRKHSPERSIPRSSRKILPPRLGPPPANTEGARLFLINCVHCHGAQGDGDGPAAPFLKESPANLKNDEVRRMSDQEIYGVLTHGKDMMPSFKGELSAEERWQLAHFVFGLSRPATANGETERGHP
jgi:mono/diheme cytochrome c family protein